MPLLNPVGVVGESTLELFYLSVIVMLLIIVPIMITTLWYAWHYREGGDGNYSPEFSESKLIEKVTLYVPLMTIAVLGTLTWIYTHRLDPYRPLGADVQPYEVQAVSLDYKWLFVYPEEGIATVNELVVPAHQPVTLRITSDPMMTSIFIPGLISQIYAMPGMETRANFYAPEEATMLGANAMYSGPGFPHQRFNTRIVDQDGFEQWVNRVKSGQDTEKKNEAMLDFSRFNELVKRSVDNPVTYFASVQPDLFTKIVRKYMPNYVMSPLPTTLEYDEVQRGAIASVKQAKILDTYARQHGEVSGSVPSEKELEHLINKKASGMFPDPAMVAAKQMRQYNKHNSQSMEQPENGHSIANEQKDGQ